MDSVEEPARAAGVIARSPAGRVLMCRRVDDGSWAFPAGHQKPGESIERCAMREFQEETGYRLGGVGTPLMRRVKDGCDFTTFVADVDDEFSPKLNHEHSSWEWFEPTEVLEEAE